MNIEGKKNLAIPRDIQFHPLSDQPIHVDFLRLSEDSKITLDIPTRFINEEASPGLKRGGVLNVNYTNGTAAIELRESSASDLGIVKIAEGSGISVTYSNGEATIATSGNPSGKRVSLDSTLSYVTKASSGGVTTFTVDLQSASVFGGSTLALDTKAEVITSGGETVYPVVERSSGNISFAFSELPSAPGDGDYEVLLIVVA